MKKLRRLPAFNWITPKTANKRQADGLYEKDFQVIGIDMRLGDKRLIKTIIHEILHYLSDSYPNVVQKLSEKKISQLTNQIFKLIKK